MADTDSLNDRRLQQHERRRRRDLAAFEHADHRDPPLHGHRLQRFAEIGAPGKLQNVVGAVVAGDLENTLRPILFHAINAMVGAESEGALELVLTG